MATVTVCDNCERIRPAGEESWLAISLKTNVGGGIETLRYGRKEFCSRDCLVGWITNLHPRALR